MDVIKLSATRVYGRDKSKIKLRLYAMIFKDFFGLRGCFCMVLGIEARRSACAVYILTTDIFEDVFGFICRWSSCFDRNRA